jgi:ribosomal protein L37AE/L43A
VQRIAGTSPGVDEWMCTACGMHFAVTVVNPALSLVGVLPTPALRTAALLAVLRTEGTHRSDKDQDHTMTVTVCFPVDQIVQFDAMATVDTTLWRCRICGRDGTARTTPQATSDAVAHLSSDHGGVGDCPPSPPQGIHHDRAPRGGDALGGAR